MHRCACWPLLAAVLLTGCGPSAAPAAPGSAGLSLHPVVGEGEAGATPDLDPRTGGTARDPDGQLLELGPAALSGDDVATATADDRAGRASVVVEWTPPAVRTWQTLTGAAACRPPDDVRRRIAFVVDGDVLSAPVVDAAVGCDVGILGGTASIGGELTAAQASDLAERITASAG